MEGVSYQILRRMKPNKAAESRNVHANMEILRMTELDCK